MVKQSADDISLTVLDSIFKNNKAIQVGTTNGGGAIALNTVTASSGVDLLVLSSVFELNEATSVGGALQLLDQNGTFRLDKSTQTRIKPST